MPPHRGNYRKENGTWVRLPFYIREQFWNQSTRIQNVSLPHTTCLNFTYSSVHNYWLSMHPVSSTIPDHEQTTLCTIGHEAIVASWYLPFWWEEAENIPGSLGHWFQRMGNYLKKTIQNNVSYSNHKRSYEKTKTHWRKQHMLGIMLMERLEYNILSILYFYDMKLKMHINKTLMFSKWHLWVIPFL